MSDPVFYLIRSIKINYRRFIKRVTNGPLENSFTKVGAGLYLICMLLFLEGINYYNRGSIYRHVSFNKFVKIDEWGVTYTYWCQSANRLMLIDLVEWGDVTLQVLIKVLKKFIFKPINHHFRWEIKVSNSAIFLFVSFRLPFSRFTSSNCSLCYRLRFWISSFSWKNSIPMRFYIRFWFSYKVSTRRLSLTWLGLRFHSMAKTFFLVAMRFLLRLSLISLEETTLLRLEGSCFVSS